MSELNQNPFEDLAEECGIKFVWLVEYCHDGVWWADRIFESFKEGNFYMKLEVEDQKNLSSAYRISKIAILESRTVERESTIV